MWGQHFGYLQTCSLVSTGTSRKIPVITITSHVQYMQSQFRPSCKIIVTCTMGFQIIWSHLYCTHTVLRFDTNSRFHDNKCSNDLSFCKITVSMWYQTLQICPTPQLRFGNKTLSRRSCSQTYMKLWLTATRSCSPLATGARAASVHGCSSGAPSPEEWS